MKRKPVEIAVKNTMEHQGQDSAQPNAGLQIIGKKTCNKCKSSLPVTDFYKSSYAKDGLQHTCKTCKKIAKRKTEFAFISDSVPEGKCYCSECRQLKELNESNFYKSKISKSSKVLICIDCRKMKTKQRINNDESLRNKNKERCRIHYENNVSKYRSSSRKWKSENKIKVYESHKKYMQSEKAKELRRKSQANRYKINPEKHIAISCANDSRIRKARPKWQKSIEITTYYRLARIFGLEVDHIVPIKSNLVCGLHCLDNFQLLTREQNASKGNRFWPDMPTGEY